MLYGDIVARGLILPKKARYTITDFRKLLEAGYIVKAARWICICSAIYHSGENARSLDSLERLEIRYPDYVKPRAGEMRWK